MIAATFLHSLAAQIAWQDGRENGVNGMLAILFCIRNKIAAGHDGGDLGRIIQREHLCRQARNPHDILEIPDVRDPSFSQLLGYVEGVFDNSIVDRLTAGSLYWANPPVGGHLPIHAVVGTLNLWR